MSRLPLPPRPDLPPPPPPPPVPRGPATFRQRAWWPATLGAILVLVGASVAALLVARDHGRAGASTPGSARVADARVTRDDRIGSYRRADGGSDATTGACGTGRRPQNEPTIAVDPRNPQVVVAGANEFCTEITGESLWMGYYRSTDGGTTWSDGLLPGYAADDSAAGLASPAHRLCVAGSDPTQSFDREGRVFYGFLCINRQSGHRFEPDRTSGSIMVATYEADGARYARTVLLFKGSPQANEDKVNLAVDQTGGPGSGNVYVVWNEVAPSGGTVVLFARSIDHGATFSNPADVTGVVGASSPDLAVGPNGAVYLAYRNRTQEQDGIWLLRSTDQGQSFPDVSFVSSLVSFDSDQFTPRGRRECGDGRTACRFTFSRFFSKAAVAADASGVHVVWSARSSVNGQARIFVRSSPDGMRWAAPPEPLDRTARGHQDSPDIASAGGVITVAFYDSRNDAAYDPQRPPGNTAQGTSSGSAVDVFVARSRDGGKTWKETRVTTVSSNFDLEVEGDAPFFGDYLYVSAVPGGTSVAWTDSRDVVLGSDPRETGADDHKDGFDVFAPCRWEPNDINAKSWRLPSLSDPCLSKGGSDENIYAARIPADRSSGG